MTRSNRVPRRKGGQVTNRTGGGSRVVPNTGGSRRQRRAARTRDEKKGKGQGSSLGAVTRRAAWGL